NPRIPARHAACPTARAGRARTAGATPRLWHAPRDSPVNTDSGGGLRPPGCPTLPCVTTGAAPALDARVAGDIIRRPNLEEVQSCGEYVWLVLVSRSCWGCAGPQRPRHTPGGRSASVSAYRAARRAAAAGITTTGRIR